MALHLNCLHEVIGLHAVSKGTIASSLVHPREIFKAALLANSFVISSATTILPDRNWSRGGTISHDRNAD